MNHPVATTQSGIVIANFSSPHPFVFDDGTTLPGCPSEMTKALTLESKEVEVTCLASRWVDIKLSFSMSEVVREALAALQADPSVDVILVPFPVMGAIKEAGLPLGKARVCRVADRVAKTVCADKFCI